MNTSLFALRNLKYRPLPHLFHRKLAISSVDKIERDVLNAIASDLTGGFRLASSLSDLEIVLAKHGFLDLDFVTSRELLTAADRVDCRAFRELGYSPRPPDPAPDMEPALKRQLGSDRSCLEVLMEGIKNGETYLRLFLNSDYSRDAMPRIFDELQRQRSTGMTGNEAVTAAMFAVADRMKANFPITFTIEDACLTNSDAIWLAKHAYL